MKGIFKIAKSLFFIGFIAVVFHSCTNDQTLDVVCDLPDDISYQNDVFPIIETSCAISYCHVNNFSFGDFTTYDNTLTYLDNETLLTRVSAGTMPPPNSKPLESCEVQLIEIWIENGYPDN